MHRLLLLLAVLVLNFGSSVSEAAKPSGDNGAWKKECKRIVKKLSKDGWQVYGGKGALSVVLENHYQLLAEKNDTMTTLIGRGTGPTLEAAKRRAETDASKQYATMRSTTVSAVTSMGVNNETVNGQTTTHQQVHHGSRTSSHQLVSGLEATVCLSRSLDGGNVEVMAYYLVSKQ